MSEEATRGPWYVGAKPHKTDRVFGVDRVDGSPQTVAIVYGYSGAEQAANARLIEAAPELLELARDLFSVHAIQGPIIDQELADLSQRARELIERMEVNPEIVKEVESREGRN